MKNLYDDINTLLNDIKSDIEDVLMDEVLDTIKEIELKHIEDDVYSVYKPSVYKRRGNSGGLSDPDNIVGSVKNMELDVENIASFNQDYGSSNKGNGLAELVNNGDRVSGYMYDYPGSFNQPRPFLDNTIEEIENTNLVEDALSKGLKKRNYDVF